MLFATRRSALLLFPAALATAADDSPPTTTAEPDDIGAVFRVHNQRVEPLEARRARWATRNQKIFTERDLLTIEGAASPIRFRAQDKLEFVVRCLMRPRGFDPMPLPPPLWRDPLNFELLRVDQSRERPMREVIVGQRGFVNSTGSSGVFLYVRAWGEYSFLLRPGEPLTPGEYAFKYGLSHTEAKELHCFGIDA